MCLGGEPMLVTMEVMLLGRTCNVVKTIMDRLSSVTINSVSCPSMNCTTFIPSGAIPSRSFLAVHDDGLFLSRGVAV